MHAGIGWFCAGMRVFPVGNAIICASRSPSSFFALQGSRENIILVLQATRQAWQPTHLSRSITFPSWHDVPVKLYKLYPCIKNAAWPLRVS